MYATGIYATRLTRISVYQILNLISLILKKIYNDKIGGGIFKKNLPKQGTCMSVILNTIMDGLSFPYALTQFAVHNENISGEVLVDDDGHTDEAFAYSAQVYCVNINTYIFDRPCDNVLHIEIK